MKRSILHFVCLVFLLSAALHASAFTSDGIDYTILSEQAVSVSAPNYHTGDFLLSTALHAPAFTSDSIFTSDRIVYHILSEDAATVEMASHKGYEGDLSIPEQVVHDGKTYSVTAVGDYAFAEWWGLTSVTIPASVTTIGDYAFGNCSSLTGIEVVPENPDYCSIDGVLYDKAVSRLMQCPPTKGSVTIPGSVTTIGNGAFTGCSILTSITIPRSVTAIGDYAFAECKSLASITIPESVTTIGYGAFRGCSGLTSVTIPESVTTIGESAFSYCKSLASVTLPGSVTVIGDYAFDGCSSLASVTLPESVTTIGDYAFSYCKSLASITIPESVTTIGDHAFTVCSRLTAVTIPGSVTAIGDGAFAHCLNLTRIEVAPENPDYCSIDGILYDKAVSTLIQCPPTKGSVTIPGSVTTIGYYAFSDCSSLASVTLPESVTTIGDYAFDWCRNLTSVTIPKSVTTIGDYAFDKCSNLTSVYCKMPDPVPCNPYFSYEVRAYAVLYVPIGCKPKYQTVKPWSGFAHIEETSYSGIGNMAADRTVRIIAGHGVLTVKGLGNGEVVTVYDMNGRTVYRGTAHSIPLQPGSYVVRTGSKTVKVVI